MGLGHGFRPGAAYEAERPVIARAIATRTLAEWTTALTASSVPFAPVLTLGEAMESEQAAALGVMRPTTVGGEPVTVPATPVRISTSAGASEPPSVGPHRRSESTLPRSSRSSASAISSAS